MFDFDAGKLLIIGLVALVVIGPKDLPRVLRQVGQMVARLRKMAGEFQGQFMDAIKEADLQDLRDEVAKLKDSATLDLNFDPANDLRTELTKAVDGTVVSAPLPEPVIASSDLESSSIAADRDGFRLPEPAEAGAELNAAAAGFAPTADLASAGTPHVDPSTVGMTVGHDDGAAPERRKVVVRRHRPVSRFDGPSDRGPAPNRPRNIRPPRRETPNP